MKEVSWSVQLRVTLSKSWRRAKVQDIYHLLSWKLGIRLMSWPMSTKSKQTTWRILESYAIAWWISFNTSKTASTNDFVFDSYLQRSLKDSQYQKREKKSPIELDQIQRKTPLPVQMDRFWPSSKNKASLETLVLSCNSPMLSMEPVSNRGAGQRFWHFWYNWPSGGSVTEAPQLNADIEEAGLRTVLRAPHATKNGSKRLVVLSSDTDVLILLLYYWSELNSEGLQEPWVKPGWWGRW